MCLRTGSYEEGFGHLLKSFSELGPRKAVKAPGSRSVFSISQGVKSTEASVCVCPWKAVPEFHPQPLVWAAAPFRAATRETSRVGREQKASCWLLWTPRGGRELSLPSSELKTKLASWPRLNSLFKWVLKLSSSLGREGTLHQNISFKEETFCLSSFMYKPSLLKENLTLNVLYQEKIFIFLDVAFSKLPQVWRVEDVHRKTQSWLLCEVAVIAAVPVSE